MNRGFPGFPGDERLGLDTCITEYREGILNGRCPPRGNLS